jgi:hypothetical protein
MRLKILITLVALAPTLAMAQSSLPAASTTGKSAGMPPDPTPQAIQNTVKAVETVSGATSITPNHSAAPSSTYSSEKSEGSSLKSTYTYNYCTINGVTSIC